MRSFAHMITEQQWGLSAKDRNSLCQHQDKVYLNMSMDLGTFGNVVQSAKCWKTSVFHHSSIKLPPVSQINLHKCSVYCGGRELITLTIKLNSEDLCTAQQQAAQHYRISEGISKIRFSKLVPGSTFLRLSCFYAPPHMIQMNGSFSRAWWRADIWLVILDITQV